MELIIVFLGGYCLCLFHNFILSKQAKSSHTTFTQEPSKEQLQWQRLMEFCGQSEGDPR